MKLCHLSFSAVSSKHAKFHCSTTKTKEFHFRSPPPPLRGDIGLKRLKIAKKRDFLKLTFSESATIFALI